MTCKSAGFCYGVKRAVETTKKLKAENPDKEIRILGELIHNARVIKELDEAGIKTVDEIPDKCSGICVIRSHGMPPEKIAEIEKKGCEIADLTCPDVKKVQRCAIELGKAGYPVIVLGKPEHPEVVAIKANALTVTEDVFVISEVSELSGIKEVLKERKKAGVVVQTTQKQELLQKLVSSLIETVSEVRVFNTICKSTSRRQSEAREMAKNVDLMIVVGGKNSANTTHLAEITKGITKTIHIETADELDSYGELLKDVQNIGITAGASTPDYIIKETAEKLENI